MIIFRPVPSGRRIGIPGPFFSSQFWACIYPARFVLYIFEWISRIRGGFSELIQILCLVNWLKIDLDMVSIPDPASIIKRFIWSIISMIQLYTNFKYFLVVTAQWNFLHSFLSSIPEIFLDVFRISKYFSIKLVPILVWDFRTFLQSV